MMNAFYPGQPAEDGCETLWNDFVCRSDQGRPQSAARDFAVTLHAEETVRLGGDDDGMNSLRIRVGQSEAYAPAVRKEPSRADPGENLLSAQTRRYRLD